MNPFRRTEITIPTSNHPIRHEGLVICAGSCFTGMIGNQLRKYKFKVLVQPFGTIFNPITLSDLFMADPKAVMEHSFIYEGVALNWLLNSNPFIGQSINLLNESINKMMSVLQTKLSNATHVIITLGTAHVYFLKEGLVPVSNCHQLPSSLFISRTLKVEEVEIKLSELLNFLFQKNPKLHIVFTVSPVRHIKDQLSANSLSKAILRVAVENVCNSFHHATYFPSFELMMDDLRDYRFYASDLLHPSLESEQYIWDKFVSTYIPFEEQKSIKLLDEILLSLLHNPKASFSDKYKKFKFDLKRKIDELNSKIDLSEELRAFEELP